MWLYLFACVFFSWYAPARDPAPVFPPRTFTPIYPGSRVPRLDRAALELLHRAAMAPPKFVSALWGRVCRGRRKGMQIHDLGSSGCIDVAATSINYSEYFLAPMRRNSSSTVGNGGGSVASSVMSVNGNGNSPESDAGPVMRKTGSMLSNSWAWFTKPKEEPVTSCSDRRGSNRPYSERLGSNRPIVHERRGSGEEWVDLSKPDTRWTLPSPEPHSSTIHLQSSTIHLNHQLSILNPKPLGFQIEADVALTLSPYPNL